MNITELVALIAYRHGDRGPLAERWKQLQGKPLSPLLHEFILYHFIDGNPFRRRGAQGKIRRKVTIKRFHFAASQINPSPKKLAILETAEKFGLSVKSVERIVYDTKQKPSRRSSKK